MTDREWKALENYTCDVASDVGLGHWTIEIDRDPSEEGSYAQVNAVEGKFFARIQVAHNFRELKPEQQRETIIHELFHLHFASSLHVIQKDLAKHPAISDHEYDFIWASFLRQHEYGVSSVAKVFACDFDLIQWSK